MKILDNKSPTTISLCKYIYYTKAGEIPRFLTFPPQKKSSVEDAYSNASLKSQVSINLNVTDFGRQYQHSWLEFILLSLTEECMYKHISH